MDQRPLMVWSRLWLAIATLPLLMIAAACGSSSPSTGNGPVADQQAVASNGCKLGNSSQVTGCQMADLDNAIDPAARAEYPQLLRQAAKACTMDPGSVAGMLLANRSSPVEHLIPILTRRSCTLSSTTAHLERTGAPGPSLRMSYQSSHTKRLRAEEPVRIERHCHLQPHLAITYFALLS